jgi:hypothetical protein
MIRKPEDLPVALIGARVRSGPAGVGRRRCGHVSGDPTVPEVKPPPPPVRHEKVHEHAHRSLHLNAYAQAAVFLAIVGVVLYTVLFTTYKPVHDFFHSLRHSLVIVPCH